MEMTQHFGETDRDNAVRASGILNKPINPEFSRIVTFAALDYHTEFAGLSIVLGNQTTFIAKENTSVVDICQKHSFCAIAIRHPGEILLVRDARDDDRFCRIHLVIHPPFIRFYAGVPIIDRQGYALGTLWVGDEAARLGAFDPTSLLIRGREVERELRW